MVDNVSVPVKSFQDPIDAQIYSSCLVSRGNVIIKDTHVLDCSANLSTIQQTVVFGGLIGSTLNDSKAIPINTSANSLCNYTGLKHFQTKHADFGGLVGFSAGQVQVNKSLGILKFKTD